MFEWGLVFVIGALLIFWLKRSQGAQHCSGCSWCPYQRPDAPADPLVDFRETSQQTLDQVKSGKICMIKSIPPGKIKDQTIRFGLTEGKKVLCKTAIPAGPIVLKVDRQEIALGRKLAERIGVNRVEDAKN